MRIAIDIPDPLYRELTAKAAEEKRSVNELILRGIEAGLLTHRTKKGRRASLPLVRSKRPGSSRIDNAKIYELIDFP
jgi:hypothetical protein